MARGKSTPTKSKNSNRDYESTSLAFGYIPVKKRKIKRKTRNLLSFRITKPVEAHKQYYLGQICLGSTNNALPEDYNSCKVTFLPPQDEQDCLILDMNDCSVLVKILLDTNFIKEIISCKMFALSFSKSDEIVSMDLHLLGLPFTKFTKKFGTCIKSIFSLLYDISDENSDCDIRSKQLGYSEITQLYKDIRDARQVDLNLDLRDVQHPLLKPTLRPYQQDAVKWMIYKEKQQVDENGAIHPLYTRVTLKSGLDIYLDKYTGFIELSKPVVVQKLKGGILADEMGLGKTVEVLACILCNPKQPATACSVNARKAPTITKNKGKRRLERSHSELWDEPKKLKVPGDWVKSSSKQSQVRVALQMWYESCLQDVNKKQKSLGPQVQCVCGTLGETGAFACVDCGKLQHGSCLGYNKAFGDYRCPQCWSGRDLIECKATLIVCPMTLRKQWCSEISRHVKGDFRVLQYDGYAASSVYPTEFQTYDLVVTTYNVLQTELRLTESETEMSFRNQRKYSRPCCPLTLINWWRLCLDEAQTVEVPTSMVSAMAQKLSAHLRWAVTGTPISKEISDLYGLVDYLRIEPYNDDLTWKHLLFTPYLQGKTAPMYKFLSEVMWRSSKGDVIDQINIPSQTVKEYWLNFSAVEKYFYKCEHDVNTDQFKSKICSYDPKTSLQSFNRGLLKKVLAPLLSLRQVCTFPNSIKIRYLATKKPVTSMKELLDALIDKNTTENEEFLRIVISSLNGLAGIYLLLQNARQAIEEYHNVLQLYTRFKEEEKVVKLTVDKLQIVHTMHNLADLLDNFPVCALPTLRDCKLREDCENIERKYIQKFINQSISALQDSLTASESVTKLQNSFSLKPGQWYTDLLKWIYIHNYNSELNSRIENAHHMANVECNIDLYDDRTVQLMVATWDETISDLRETTINVINHLYEHRPDLETKILISKDLVQKATDCHLRPQKKTSKKKCPICIANDHLKSYEYKLFLMVKRKQMFEEMSLQGSWKPTSEELIFKSLLALAKTKNVKSNIIKDGEVHMNLIEALKKEFKEVRKLWTYLDQQICAQDELSMCKIRLRLRQPDDEPPQKTNKVNRILKDLNYELANKTETIHVLGEHELDYHRSVLQRDQVFNMAKLEKNLGIRKYLETLRKQQYEGQNPDPCPICKNELEFEWSIIPCGHSYCIECIQSLVQTVGYGQVAKYIVCSVCRGRHLVNEISYIKPGAQQAGNGSNEIKGNFSTKIEAIINLLLELKADDENVKVLIFSKWVSVLQVLLKACLMNDVTSELLHQSNLEKKLSQFKDQKLNITALLLPINLGSKGLNLIEATHVILAEPLLNPSDELQAIGRVHRIGQTKQTFVHKFIVKNTVEENIYKAVSANTENWDKSKVTLGQLINLFSYDESENSEDS